MLQDHILLALLWILFCFLHSLLASLTLKERLQQTLKQNFIYYRIFYTLFAFATFIPIIFFLIKISSPLLYTQNIFSLAGGIIVATAGIIIMAVCIKKYFISLSGIRSLFTGSTKGSLMISGIHNHVRHPLYSGTFLFIWGLFILKPTPAFLITNTIITGYTLIGIILEERKLVAEFGNDYEEYRKKVPKLIPFFKRELRN